MPAACAAARPRPRPGRGPAPAARAGRGLQPLAQRLRLHQLHGEEDVRAERPHVVDGHHVRVRDAGHGLSLAREVGAAPFHLPGGGKRGDDTIPPVRAGQPRRASPGLAARAAPARGACRRAAPGWSGWRCMPRLPAHSHPSGHETPTLEAVDGPVARNRHARVGAEGSGQEGVEGRVEELFLGEEAPPNQQHELEAGSGLD